MQLVGGRGTPTPNVYVHSRSLLIVSYHKQEQRHKPHISILITDLIKSD